MTAAGCLGAEVHICYCLGHCSRVSGSGWWVVKVELRLLLASAKQVEWREATTRLRTRAARGTEMRCLMLEREASVRTIEADVC